MVLYHSWSCFCGSSYFLFYRSEKKGPVGRGQCQLINHNHLGYYRYEDDEDDWDDEDEDSWEDSEDDDWDDESDDY